MKIEPYLQELGPNPPPPKKMDQFTDANWYVINHKYYTVQTYHDYVL